MKLGDADFSLFGSYMLIQYALNLKYEDAALVIGLVLFVQTLTFMSIILTSFWSLFCDPDSNNEEEKPSEHTKVEKANLTTQIEISMRPAKVNLCIA